VATPKIIPSNNTVLDKRLGCNEFGENIDNQQNAESLSTGPRSISRVRQFGKDIINMFGGKKKDKKTQNEILQYEQEEFMNNSKIQSH
jgi:hypothetical protein